METTGRHAAWRRWACLAIPVALAGGLSALATTRALAADPGNGQGACRRDLEFIPGFLLENDTGAPEHIRRLGGPALDKAMAEARDWLLAATDELEDVTVTPSPPPGDPWKVGM